MDRLPVYCRTVRCAEAVMREENDRVAISAELEDPGDGLYRAVLQGERGELSLGVLEPREGKLVLRRRPERCDLVRLGTLKGVQVVCAFSFRKKSLWRETRRPCELLREDFFGVRLERIPRAWWRRTEGRLFLALPYERGVPFPLEPIFCFARIQWVEGETCAVYVFDENAEPQFW